MILLFTFFPSQGFSNIPVPSLFGVGAPFFLALKTVGLIFIAIIILEAGVLRFGLKIAWKKSIISVLIANLISSFLGVLISGNPLFIVLLFILPFFLMSYFSSKEKTSLLVAIILGFAPSLCILLWIGFTWYQARGLKTWALYGSLVPAFLLSSIIEFRVLSKRLNNKHLLKWTFLSNCVSYVMLAIVMAILSYKPLKNPLLTYDYLYVSAENLAKEGNAGASLEVLHKMRELREEYDPFYITRELRTAEILANKGFKKEAEQILDRVKNTEREKSSWDEGIQKGIQRLERILSDDS